MRSQGVGVFFSAFVIFAAAQAQCEEKIHELKASPTTVHRGFFDASLKPVLTIDSGDIVRLWTTTGNPRCALAVKPRACGAPLRGFGA